jgi:hypothetical protein
MEVKKEKSTTRVITKDNVVFFDQHESREAAFEFLLEFTKDLEYKEAVILDTGTDAQVLSLRIML